MDDIVLITLPHIEGMAGCRKNEPLFNSRFSGIKHLFQ